MSLEIQLLLEIAVQRNLMKEKHGKKFTKPLALVIRNYFWLQFYQHIAWLLDLTIILQETKVNLNDYLEMVPMKRFRMRKKTQLYYWQLWKVTTTIIILIKNHWNAECLCLFHSNLISQFFDWIISSWNKIQFTTF